LKVPDLSNLRKYLMRGSMDLVEARGSAQSKALSKRKATNRTRETEDQHLSSDGTKLASHRPLSI